MQHSYSGQTCLNGACSDGGIIKCNNDGDCLIEAMGSPECRDNSMCLSWISYQCINPGNTQSYCNYTSEEKCTPCPNGCENNQCINKGCDQIGLRQSGKYCSAEYKLITQKANNLACEANFECKTNICTEGYCQSKIQEPNYLIYWIIGGVIILLAVVLIVVMIVLKKK